MRCYFKHLSMADDSLFLIDIDKVLREKAPDKVRYIPRFVVSYLKRIVHQDELNGFLRLHGLAPLCIPINKTGKQAKDFPRLVEEAFASDNQLLMFPAGLCSRRQRGVIRDLEWKKAFVVKSVQHRRDVVPIHFDGQNSNFFYNLANLCKALGIKFNIAMLYLADEMLKNRHKTFTITIGKPIPWQTFDKSKTPQQWAQYVKDIVYNLN